MDRKPSRRVILLGASNLVRSLPTVVQTIRRIWPGPVEIMAAMGHGRSYGQDSVLLGRKISGIFPCALWENLQERPPLPTCALITDVGNDLLYGVPTERIVQWVAACLERLVGVSETTIISELPLESVRSLGNARFRLFRTLMFPRCRLSKEEILIAAETLNAQVVQMAKPPKISVIPVSKSWYGFDPIHPRRGMQREVWSTLLAPWCDAHPLVESSHGLVWQSCYLRCLAPSERSIFGWRQQCAQPCGRLKDGTTISLY
jgi:hypothetical protein